MTGRRMLEIGLLVGVVAGFLVRGASFPACGARNEPATVVTPVWPAGAYFGTYGSAGGSYAYARLERVNLRGRDLRGADFRGATLRAVDFTGARLDGARFDGAMYDPFCRWPIGFDPSLCGAVLNHWPHP